MDTVETIAAIDRNEDTINGMPVMPEPESDSTVPIVEKPELPKLCLKVKDNDSWEPENNSDRPELISAYEEARTKRQALDKKEKRKRTYAVDNFTNDNTIEEIPKPRGFDRDLPPEKIVGSTNATGELMFLIKWVGCEELDLVAAKIANQKAPAFVIAYYESKPGRREIETEARIPRDIPDSLLANATSPDDRADAIPQQNSAISMNDDVHSESSNIDTVKDSENGLTDITMKSETLDADMA